MILTYSHTCRPGLLHLVPFQILCQLDRQPFWDRPGIQADRLLVESSLSSTFSAGLFSGSIVKAQRGLALCPARYVMWHEAG